MALGTGDYFSLAGDLLGGLTSLSAGKAEAKGYSKAAQFASDSAGLVRRSTDIQLMQQRRKAQMALGGQQADIAGSGLAAGSATDIIRDSARQAALDSALIRQQGEISATDYLSKASSYSAQADATKKASKGGFFGSLLKGVGAIAGSAFGPGGAAIGGALGGALGGML